MYSIIHSTTRAQTTSECIIQIFCIICTTKKYCLLFRMNGFVVGQILSSKAPYYRYSTCNNLYCYCVWLCEIKHLKVQIYKQLILKYCCLFNHLTKLPPEFLGEFKDMDLNVRWVGFLVWYVAGIYWVYFQTIEN